MNREEKISLAQEILNQLGGHRFVVMTGARNISALDSGLCFKLPGTMTKNHVNYVKIELNSLDLYDVEFWNYRMKHYDVTKKLIARYDGVYNDMLVPLFKQNTGLEVTL